MFWRSPSPSLSAPVPDVALVSFFCPLVRTVHPHTRFSTHHNNLFKCCSQFCPHLHSHYYKSNFWKRLDLSSYTASSMKPSWINITLEPLLSVPLPHTSTILFIFLPSALLTIIKDPLLYYLIQFLQKTERLKIVFIFSQHAQWRHTFSTEQLLAHVRCYFIFPVFIPCRWKSATKELPTNCPTPLCFHFSYRC